MFMTVHLITTLTHPEENVSKHPQYVSKHNYFKGLAKKKKSPLSISGSVS